MLPINRDGLTITQPVRLEELYFNAPVNESIASGIMPTNVQQGLAPLYNEMLNPPTYGESISNLEPMTELEKQLKFKPKEKENNFAKGLFQLLAGAVVPGAGFLFGNNRGLAGLNRRFRQNVTDFFDRKKYGGRTRDEAYADMIAQTRGIQKQMALRPSGQVTAQDQYRGGASSANEAASRSAAKASAQKASRSAGTSSARGSNFGGRLHG